MIATVDIETEEIPNLVDRVKTIYCIAVKIDDKEPKCFTCKPTEYSDGTLQEALELINTADVIVGHNFYKFDKPVIENNLGGIIPPIIDTLIDAKITIPKDLLLAWDMNRIDYPKALLGSYSLKAFGYRLKLYKIEYDNFSSGLNKEMVEYCKRDVDITYALYQKLIAHPSYPSDKVRELEYKVAEILYKQQEFGFYFDKDKAMDLATRLKFRQMNLEQKFLQIFPPQFEADGDVVIPSKARRSKQYIERSLPREYNLSEILFQKLQIAKAGRWKFPPKSMKWLPYFHRIVYSHYLGEYQRIKLVKFNPNSRQQIASRLIKHYNWKPTRYTEKGNIKLDESVLGDTIDENNE